LLLAGYANAQAPLVAAHPAAWQAGASGQVTLSINTGDLLLVFCDPYPKVFATPSDTAKDTFNAFPTALSTDNSNVQGFWARSSTTNPALPVQCITATNVTSNQIYTAVLTGAGDPTGFAFAGSSGSATGTVQSKPGDVVVAMGMSGSGYVLNSAGWQTLSILNNNLLTYQNVSGPVTASFPTPTVWNLVLVDVPPVITAPVITLKQVTFKWTDGTPIAGSVQINQLQNTTNAIIKTFPIDASGNITGTVSLDLSQPDPLNLSFLLLDPTGNVIGTVQEILPKAMFTGVTNIVASLSLDKTTLAIRGYTWASQ
jgi:hypothetical protein